MVLLDKEIEKESNHMTKDHLFYRSNILISITVMITVQRERMFDHFNKFMNLFTKEVVYVI